MVRKRKYGSLIACAAALVFASSAFAAQVIHFSQDFTDNSLADEVGSLNNVDAALALRTQNAWRNPLQSYFGVDQAEAFDDAGGFGTAKQFRTTMANGGTLLAGNVWILDMSIISDMAAGVGSQFFSGGPGPVVEWDWLTPLNFAFAQSSVSKLAPMVSQLDNTTGAILGTAYPNGADPNPEPNPLGNDIAGAGLSSALDQVLRAKFAYHSVGTGFTRVSTQGYLGSSAIGSAGHTDGGSGTFRSDYSGGLFVQMMGGKGSGNVTYSAGHGGGANVAFNSATHENLELGLTQMTFKQVSKADSSTDGNVDLTDGATLVANWNPGGSGKNFFQGDTDGSGAVDLTDGSALVAAWTAAPAPAGDIGVATVPVGGGAAYYDASNGHVYLDVNKVAIWALHSATGQFIGSPTDLDPGANVRWTVSGTTKQSDAFTIGELMLANGISFQSSFNFGTFEWDYVPSTFGGDLGQLLPTGLSSLAGLTLTYNVLGGEEQSVQVQFVPEPTTVGLVALSLGGLVTLMRRRRA
jgi:hypothetical protein